jgi:Tol biopolymer transport system component
MDFSPDGRWLAFNALTGEVPEVFVVPVPPTGQRWQVSAAGGVQARWHPSGRSLYYLNPEGTMMAVEIAEGPGFSAGTPKPLFDVGFDPAANFDDYRVAGDGRFRSRSRAPRVLARDLNWPALLNPP